MIFPDALKDRSAVKSPKKKPVKTIAQKVIIALKQQKDVPQETKQLVNIAVTKSEVSLEFAVKNLKPWKGVKAMLRKDITALKHQKDVRREIKLVANMNAAKQIAFAAKKMNLPLLFVLLLKKEWKVD